MKLTQHAQTRIQQRGFSKFTIDIIKGNGSLQKAPGGVSKLFFGAKEYQVLMSELKRAIQLLDKAKNSYLIVDGDTIITVCKSYPK